MYDPSQQARDDEALILTAVLAWSNTTAFLVQLLRDFTGDWDAPSDCGDWTNRQLAAHLATGYVERQTELKALLDGALPPVHVNIDEVNAANVGSLTSASIEAILERLLDVRSEIEGLLARLRPQHLDTIWDNGKLRDVLLDFSKHDLDHAAQLLA